MLSAIPGVGGLSAEVIVSEIGIDMSRFETAGHLITWAGLCPNNDQSAGKRRSTRMKKGAPWLKSTLIQCAWAPAAARTVISRPNTCACARGAGQRKPSVRVAASILTAAYHMLKNGTVYQDLGANYFDNRAKDKQALRWSAA